MFACLPSVFPPSLQSLSLQVALPGGFPWRLETARHLGFPSPGLLGARGELAAPAVCWHCNFLTLLGPSAWAALFWNYAYHALQGRCLQCLRRLDSWNVLGTEQRGVGDGPGQFSQTGAEDSTVLSVLSKHSKDSKGIRLRCQEGQTKHLMKWYIRSEGQQKKEIEALRSKKGKERCSIKRNSSGLSWKMCWEQAMSF